MGISASPPTKKLTTSGLTRPADSLVCSPPPRHTTPPSSIPRPSHHPRSLHPFLRPLPCCAPLALLLLLAVSPLAPPLASGAVRFDVPWNQCALPPKVLQERVGAGTEAVLSLCLKTNAAFQVTFDNADKFYIGNSSNFRDFGVECYDIDLVLTVFDLPGGSRQYLSGGILPPEASQQAWELSVWPKFNKDLNQVVNITIANNSPSDLVLTGIDFAALGKNDTFPRGTSTTFAIDYSNVTLNFTSLPVLRDYFYQSNNRDIRPNVTTAIVMLQFSDSGNTTTTKISYALVLWQPGDPESEWQFYLYEATISPGTNSTSASGGRRLLVSTPAKSTAPPSSCSKGCCKPASPIPKTCVPKAKTYPGCLKACGCACK